VVLPLRPAPGQAFTGAGLAVHLLLGNVVALHSGLKEFWFGWRLKKLFPDQRAFQAYLQGKGPELDITRQGKKQKIRYWLRGSFALQQGKIIAHLTLEQAYPQIRQSQTRLLADPKDDLLGFRRRFLDWLDASGLCFPPAQRSKSLWRELTNPAGMDQLGRALEAYYLAASWDKRDSFDLVSFKKALHAAPKSYLARNLWGWALYKNHKIAAAREAFSAALTANPQGPGALSGLVWCDIQQGYDARALQRGQALALLRGDDPAMIKATVAYRLAKKAEQARHFPQAVKMYSLAVSLNPRKLTYLIRLAGAWSQAGKRQQGLDLLDQALGRFPRPQDQQKILKKKKELLVTKPGG
jgi:Tfp pilus assembly protein PilF